MKAVVERRKGRKTETLNITELTTKEEESLNTVFHLLLDLEKILSKKDCPWAFGNSAHEVVKHARSFIHYNMLD